MLADTDYRGGDLFNGVVLASFYECLSDCISKVALCTHVTWVPSSSTCWFKGTQDPSSVYVSGVTAGKSLCECTEKNVAISGGNVLATLTVKDPMECRSNCSLTSGCSEFTVDTAKGVCSLWDGKGKKVSQIGVLYGDMSCTGTKKLQNSGNVAV